MSDEYEKYYESPEANDDSKSDAVIATIIIFVVVIAALFWVAGQ
tara:strand:- start:217 stop:348 length:132 start_codon:yes stop_codon:yes gene_type:complete